mmetsp:Transcript_29888/g.92514  ORF Transcript_29888/g.92514 Transcript_29888/m.92514 type:complete len:239 (+) Transcript_29888:1170-1886(+)
MPVSSTTQHVWRYAPTSSRHWAPGKGDAEVPNFACAAHRIGSGCPYRTRCLSCAEAFGGTLISWPFWSRRRQLASLRAGVDSWARAHERRSARAPPSISLCLCRSAYRSLARSSSRVHRHQTRHATSRPSPSRRGGEKLTQKRASKRRPRTLLHALARTVRPRLTRKSARATTRADDDGVRRLRGHRDGRPQPARAHPPPAVLDPASRLRRGLGVAPRAQVARRAAPRAIREKDATAE